MLSIASAPLLFRVKSWQLIGLGLAGWATIYSIALINWAACGRAIANAQGGCFAVTMTLASLEARRLSRNKNEHEHVALHWADNIPTEELNQRLEIVQMLKGFTPEKLHKNEITMGFGLRAVKEGRTFVFETSRWKEPTIDLAHAQATNVNRKMASADRAVIVSIGAPDEDTRRFIKSAPIQVLAGEELKNLVGGESPNLKEV
jgi:hypothetical protein